MDIRLFAEKDWIVGGGITRIKVSELFGQYSYDLGLNDLAPDRSSRLLLLYGNNGSGKTTILKMVFYLLSPLDKKGHKKQLTKIRFSSFQVQLADGSIILAARPDYRKKGYELLIIRDGVTTAASFYTSEDDSPVATPTLTERVAKLKGEEEVENRQQRILAVLGEIGNKGNLHL